MYLKELTKFYEILVKKNKVYIWYGKIPTKIVQLPFGKYEIYEFNNMKDAKLFMNKKTEEKLKKNYTIMQNNNVPTRDMKWYLKNGKPNKIKNMINHTIKNKFIVKKSEVKTKKTELKSKKTEVKSKKIKFKIIKKCPTGKILNPKTNRCIINKEKQSESKFPKINLKSGELGKYGYSKIKTLSLKDRRKALDNAIKDYGAQKVLKKVGLIKTYQKNKSPNVSSLLHDNMKYMRKKYDNQFKSSWKKSNLFI